MTNRRQFVQQLSTLAALPALPLHVSSVQAADTSGYKAIVCVFMFGGNDSHNTLVPYDQTAYNTYAATRGGLAESNGLALPRSSLLPVTPVGLSTDSWGFHPAMPQSRSLFTAGNLAVVANVGALLYDTTLQQYQNGSAILPPQLFSHSDMQTHWHTMRPDVLATTGWGGRLADVFGSASSGRLPISVSVGPAGTFLKGNIVSPYQINPVTYNASGGIEATSRIARPPLAESAGDTIARPQDVFLANTTASRGNLLEQQYAKLVRDSADVGQFVTSAMYDVSGGGYSLKNAVPGTWSTTNKLSAQLHSVAAMIAARQALGGTRQVFYVSMGGFDNHGDQFGRDSATGNKTLLSGKHFELLRQFDEAIASFYSSIAAMGVANNVTLMTMSDFGRTLKSNGQGSDHGWGGHMMVLGGAVNGGRFFGSMPPVALNTSVDVGEGRMLPTLSSDAYCATLSRWFGATSGELAQIFPNLSRFGVTDVAGLLP